MDSDLDWKRTMYKRNLIWTANCKKSKLQKEITENISVFRDVMNFSTSWTKSRSNSTTKISKDSDHEKIPHNSLTEERILAVCILQQLVSRIQIEIKTSPKSRKKFEKMKPRTGASIQNSSEPTRPLLPSSGACPSSTRN
jgi:hypothetical protein